MKVNEVSIFKSMEYMDFKITARDTPFRLLVIYRIQPSRKNKPATRSKTSGTDAVVQ